MASIAAFDSKGVLGTALTLIYKASDFSDRAVHNLIKRIIENGEVFGIKPEGVIELRALIARRNLTNSDIDPVELFAMQFFQSMRKKDWAPGPYHSALINNLLPANFRVMKEHFPNATLAGEEGGCLSEWYATLLESMLSEEQLQKLSTPPDLDQEQESQVNEKRAKNGLALYQAVLQQDISEKDLDGVLAINRFAMQKLSELDHPKQVLSFSGDYIQLFSLSKDPLALSQAVLELLDTHFRKKVFSKKLSEEEDTASTGEGPAKVEEMKKD